jgi:hypothetical protein
LKSKLSPAVLFALLAILALLAYVFSTSSTENNLSRALSSAENQGLAPTEIAPVEQTSSTLNRTQAESSVEEESELTAADASAASVSNQPILTGQVLDENSNGIGNAWVTTWEEAQPVWTDTQGNYSMPLSGKFDRFHPRGLMAWAPDYELTYLYLAEPGPGDVTLKAAVPFTVKVLRAEDDLPIEGATARVLVRGLNDPTSGTLNQHPWTETPLVVTPSNAEGLLTVPGVSFAFLHITAPGYNEFLLQVHTAPFQWVAKLMPAAEMNIRFVLPDGSPIARAVISVDPSFQIVTTDADGWMTVPALAASDYHSLTVSWEDKSFAFASYIRGPSPPRLAHGKEITVPYREIAGTLTVNGEAKPEDFDITTAGLAYFVGTRPMPDAEKYPTLVPWVSPAEDGTFSIQAGWQGLTTQILVRRKSDQAIVLKEKLEGDGPYALMLNLDQGNLATFQINAEPAEALEAMKLWLIPRYVPGQTEKLAAIKLEQGSAQIRLLPGNWSLSLIGNGFENAPSLGPLVMPEEAHTFTYDLGPMRKVSGRLTAAGRPMTAASLHFYQPDGYFQEPLGEGPEMGERTQFAGFVIRKRIAADGNWDLGWIPDAQMEVRLDTENRWLGRGPTFHFNLPPGPEYFDLKLPVATLQFTFDGEDPPSPKDIHISHYELPEFGGKYVMFQTFYDSSFPDLSRGPVEQTVSPGKYKIYLDDPNLLFTPSEVVIHEGEYFPITVRVESAGVILAVWETEKGAWGGKVLVNALPESDATSSPRMLTAKEYNARKGGFARAYSVTPGQWKFKLLGPVAEMEDRTLTRTGVYYGEDGDSWETVVEVQAGKRTVVIVGLDADGKVTLRPEIRD